MQPCCSLMALTYAGSEYEKMIADLCQLGEEGLLTPPPCEHHPLKDFAIALSNAMKPYVGRKQIIDFKQKSAL